ncbi:flagellar basal body rod protein FlgB [Candidatus Scalindua japonica]|uniref:Flagellar basal body rod protein FlgB n=1 Tax=Candidatus Scalindua japonica TaxID=1284222 RepID=A0A286TVZ1_9BACT|nr:flagellar basal body rod protein FlgB [Candidatus Scalindua japonica]GAX60052.1 flagellar basal body rod protein FlgB [Candidatus Scalindua japonica]
MDLSDNNVVLLSKLLDLSSTKNKVIANNIANVNTPGYKKSEVSFEEELLKAVENKNIDKIKNLKESIYLSKDKSTRKDGNNVDLDKELVSFYQMSDKHNVYLEILSKKFKGMIAAIQGK